MLIDDFEPVFEPKDCANVRLQINARSAYFGRAIK